MKRTLSLLLCIVMVISLIPGFAFADNTPAPISATTTNSNTSDGVSLTKTSVYDPGTGKMKITLEAYTTGTVVSSTRAVPTDIVMVLDVSGSMTTERMTSMKNAVNNFITSTKTLNSSVTDAADKHSIAIVKFADDSFYSSSDPLAVGNHKNNSGYNYTEVIADFTTVDGAGENSLQAAVNALTSGGATSVDYGLDLAEQLFDARTTAGDGAYSERNKVIIVFADGEPNHSSGYDEEVAYNAVTHANVLKTEGASIFTVGIFDGANPADTTSDANKFMNYLSSNYPLAYGSTTREWFFGYYTVYHINPGAEPHYNTYYHAASTSNLNSVFQSISSQVGRPQITLGSTASLVDVVTDYFTIDGIGSSPEISVSTADYKGGADFTNAANWADPVSAGSSITATVSGDNDTVVVTGFDYDQNYVSATARDGSNYGKKLILEITATPNYDVIDQAAAAGTLTSGDIPTNDTAALLDSTSINAAWVASPKLTANTVTYQIAGEGGTPDPRTVGSYYRFPGAEVTLMDKPANTAEYAYGEWTTSNATISGDKFTMPAGNVTLTSTAAVNTYNITFEYLGEVPDGATALPATMSDIAVGSSVTLPSVTAPAGYSFSGWTENDLDIDAGTTTFEMPAEDLHFEGHFIAQPSEYTVEHYLMNTDGSWPATAANTLDFTADTGSSVTAQIAHHTGFEYSADKTTEVNGSSNMTDDTVPVPKGVVTADGNLVLKLYYARRQHTVSYEYVGTVPEGASVLPTDATDYYYGQEVTIKPDAAAPGYTFSGWTIRTGATAIEDGKMIMPDSDVVLRGSFTANSGTKYTVEHYFEELENGPSGDPVYTIDSTRTQTFYGTTDSTATAEPLSGDDIIGFSYEPTLSTASGTIDGNGDLVLKLYYSRTRHEVKYQYLGTVPANADPDTTEITAMGGTYKFGDEVTVAGAATAQGYEFSGWSTNDASVSAGGKFTMPAGEVTFSGYFSPAANKYTVEHYLMGTDGQYPNAADHSNTYENVKTGDTVTATVAEHTGFTYDSGYSGNVTEGTVAADGTTVLKLYYKRNQYTVSYEYLGTVPDGTSAPVDNGKYYYEQEVTLKEATIPDGYTFSGWSIRTGDASITGDKLKMPNADVVLYGSFAAKGDTPYTVEHYFEIDDDNNTVDYPETADRTTSGTGKTGSQVTAVALSGTDIIGYTFNAEKSKDTRTGTIKGDGSLVLKLYYDRTVHTVKYQYTGNVPGNAADLPADATYKFGQEVTRAADATAQGYRFSGWTAEPNVSVNADGKFNMPASEVIFTGHFIAEPNKYTVEHYLMDTAGEYSGSPAYSYQVENVKTGDSVTARTDITYTGFAYDGTAANVLSGTVAPDGSTVLKVYFARRQYSVTYQYDHTPEQLNTINPDPADLSGYTGTYYYEQIVDLKADAAAQGYLFTGWSIHTGDTAITNGKMKMPAHAVVLHGAFNADPNTRYTVEHYFEKVGSADAGNKDNYELGKTQSDLTGATGATATAMPLSGDDIIGFTFDAQNTNNIRTGEIKSDGTLVLKLYYKRVESDVIYEYTGTVPTGAVEQLPETKAYKYGTTVDVAADPVLAGYTFSGWQPWDESVVSVNGDGEFTMPERTVYFHGSFAANPSKYTVNHFLMNADGTYPAEPTTFEELTVGVTVDQPVTAVPINGLRTYTYDEDYTRGKLVEGITSMETTAGDDFPKGTVNAAGTLALNLYYSRNKYSLSYEFTGTVPAGAAAPADPTEKFVHGATVPLSSATVPAGYDFDGWYLGDTKVGNTLTMPAADTTVTGSFTPRNDVTYTVKYFLQDLNDSESYTEVVADRKVVTTGTTGAYVVGPRIDYPGYTFNMVKSTWNGHVKGDGSLVLELYYDRNVHTVTYYYYGTPPADVTITQNGSNVIPAADTYQIGVTESYKYGETFTVNAILETTDPTYNFRGWFTSNISGIDASAENASGTVLTMPDHNVVFYGALYNYAVTYDLDGGTLSGSATVAPKSVGWDDAGLLPDGTPTKSGMRFVGWNYEQTPVSATDKYSDLAANYTVMEILLTAQYERINDVVVSNDGSVKLTKTDANDPGTLLSGAVFDLYRGTQKIHSYTTDANGEINVSDLAPGAYYFVETRSPAGYVLDDTKHTFTVTANRTAQVTVTNTKSAVPDVFTDDHYAYVIGYSDGTVQPGANITRAEVATIFFRLLDDSVRERYMTTENDFTDVSEGMWFNAAVSTMSAMGIINGYPDGSFKPNGNITRAEFAAIAARFDESGNTTEASFTDIYDHWAHKEINTAAGNGWILGYEDGSFLPQQLISRAEAMTMVNRVLQRIPQNEDDLLDEMVVWPDNNDTSRWYYLMVQEATNSHYYQRKASGYEYWTQLREVRDWAALEK